ncbi:MAG: GAF domain-containing protein [Candidatus Heimdallarchaeaceae archaeon]
MKIEDMKKEELIEELQNVKKNLEYKKLIIDQNPSGLAISTSEGEVISGNLAVMKFFGLDTEEEFMKYPAKDYWVDPNNRRKMLEIMKEKGEVKDYEALLKTKDGTPKWASVSLHVIKDSKEKDIMVSAFKDISERKKAEEEASWNAAILDASNKVLLESVVSQTEEDIARTYLQVSEELTGSKFSYIVERNEEGTVDSIAISNLGWEAHTAPGSDAVQLLVGMEIRGLWSSVIFKGKSTITNDPSSEPDSIGTLEGHPPLSSFLGVPLKQKGKTFGMIGLANKEGGYDEKDKLAVERLSVAFVQTLMHKRAEILKRTTVRTELVGKMLSDLQNIGQLSDRTMFLGGETLAKRIKMKNLNGFLDAYGDMGLGELKLIEEIKEKGRWIFSGDGLIELKERVDKPTSNYALGFLCGAVSSMLAGVDVAGVETECQSVGDEFCRFVVQKKGD